MHLEKIQEVGFGGFEVATKWIKKCVPDSYSSTRFRIGGHALRKFPDPED